MKKIKNVGTSKLYSQALVVACFVVALTVTSNQLVAGQKDGESTLSSNDDGSSLDWPSCKQAKIYDCTISGNQKKVKIWDWSITGDHKEAKVYDCSESNW